VHFRIVQNHGEKVTFLGFSGGDRPNLPPGSAPDISVEAKGRRVYRNLFCSVS